MQLSAAERKRSKEERDLIMRTKVFSRIQTAQDHEDFVEGLLCASLASSVSTAPTRTRTGSDPPPPACARTDEITLRKRIAELQEYRRNGVTTLTEADRYESAKTQRASTRASAYRDSVSLSFDRGGGNGSRRPTPSGSGGGGGGGGGGASSLAAQLRARPAPPLTLASAASLQLLTPLEQRLCATLRILPRPYLFLKEVLLREWVRLKGRMGPAEARRAVVREGGAEEEAGGEWGEKVERVWEFVRDAAGLGTGGAAGGGGGEDDEEGDTTMDDATASGTQTPVVAPT